MKIIKKGLVSEAYKSKRFDARSVCNTYGSTVNGLEKWMLISGVNGIKEFRINEVEYIHSLTHSLPLTVNGFSCTDMVLFTLSFQGYSTPPTLKQSCLRHFNALSNWLFIYIIHEALETLERTCQFKTHIL